MATVRADQTYILEIQWDSSGPDDRAATLPRLVGPFDTREEAQHWGDVNIPNGVWNVAPLIYPYLTARL